MVFFFLFLSGDGGGGTGPHGQGQPSEELHPDLGVLTGMEAQIQEPPSAALPSATMFMGPPAFVPQNANPPSGGGYYRDRVGIPVGLDYTPPPAVVQEATVTALGCAPVAHRRPREGKPGRERGTGKPPSGGGPRHSSTGPALISDRYAFNRSRTPDLNSTGGRRAPHQGRQRSLSPKVHTLGSMPTSDTQPPPSIEDGGVKLPLVRPPKRRELPEELLEKYKHNPSLAVPENMPENSEPQVKVEVKHREIRRSHSECDLVLKAANRLSDVVKPGSSVIPRRSRSARDVPSVADLKYSLRDDQTSLQQPFPSHPWLQKKANCKNEGPTRHTVI